MGEKLNFWQTKEWIETKTLGEKTDKLMTKVEYLKYIGAKNFTEQKYKDYLKIMGPEEQKSLFEDKK